MRETRILPLLLLAALTAAACGATPVLAGAAPRPPAAEATQAGGHSGAQALGVPVEAAPRRILFVGASVTEGWFASSSDRTYPALVVKGLANGRRVRARMLAHPGATAEDAALWDLTIQSDFVVLQIATNDFVRDTPVDVYAASYTEVLGQLRAASPRADIVCLGAWLDPGAVNRLGVAAVDYNVATRTDCEAAGGRYVDLSAVYLDVRNHGPAGRPTYHGPGDLFHPNDRGHAELASLILATDGVPEASRAVS
jgi:lysophospholipase L1-like esterase